MTLRPLAMAATLALVACSGGETPSTTTTPGLVAVGEAITIVVPEAATLAVHGSLTLKAEVRSTAAQAPLVVWATEPSTVAAIDQSGVLRGLAPGAAVVRASVFGADGKLLSATLDVTVTEAVSCVSDAGCSGGVCVRATKTCRSPGGSCAVTDDCGDAEICRRPRCAATCSAASPCASGFACVEGGCEPIARCNASAGCAAAEVCNATNRVCQARGAACSAGCGFGETCVGDTCREAQPCGGELPDCVEGTSCHVASGFCRQTGGACGVEGDCTVGEFCLSSTRTCVAAAACSTALPCAAPLVCNLEKRTCQAPGSHCTAAADCGLGEFCFGPTASCIAPAACSATTACPAGFTCNVSRRRCQLAFGTCNADGSGCGAGEVCHVATKTCVPPNRTCSETSDCGSGEICKAGRCSVPIACDGDGLCEGALLCRLIDSICVGAGEACLLDEDCGGEQTCSDGFCRSIPRCAADGSGCAPGQVCNLSTLVCQGSGGACTSTGNGCGKGETCNTTNRRCQPAGGVCTTDGAGCGRDETCLPPLYRCGPAPACSTSNQACPPSLLCNVVSGKCQWPAQTCPTPGCAFGEACASGRCVAPECPPACPGKLLCNAANLRCQAPGTRCSRNSDCGSAEICSGTGLCSVVSCSQADPACPAGLRCATSLQRCQGFGEACATDGDCLTGETCGSAGRCQSACPSGGGCPAGLVCRLATKTCQAAGATCSAGTDCGRGEACDAASHTCGPACTSDADCGTNKVCGRSNACQAAGATCSTAIQCGASEICGGTSCTPAPVTRIVLAPTSASVSIGSFLPLVATGYDAQNAVVTGISYSWRSSNGSIATVSSSGVVTGVGGGSAEITALVGSITSNAVSVTVPTPPPSAPKYQLDNPTRRSRRIAFTPDSKGVIVLDDGNTPFPFNVTAPTVLCPAIGGEYPARIAQMVTTPSGQIFFAGDWRGQSADPMFSSFGPIGTGCFTMTAQPHGGAPAAGLPVPMGGQPVRDADGGWWFVNSVALVKVTSTSYRAFTDSRMVSIVGLTGLLGADRLFVADGTTGILVFSNAGAVLGTAATPVSLAGTVTLGNDGYGFNFDATSAMAISPNGNRLYVAAMMSGRVLAYDVSTNTPTLVGNVSVGGRPSRITVTPSGNYLYVGNASTVENAVTVLNAADLTVASKIITDTQPVDVTVSFDGNWAASANFAGKTWSLWPTGALR